MPRALALSVLLLATGPAGAGVVQPDLSPTETGVVAGSASLAIGEPLLVVLPGQAGTGYAWEARPADGAILETQTARCAAARAEGDARVGVTIPACFAYAGRAPGVTTLTFVYRRSWDVSPDGALRYDLTITVGR
ncbi:MAG: protease inhibitor I42 family protein [Amaricoccus sp.]|uniref:protease inhibitor I42 family protein n=1 Tax=Amaricoccus sp. TaxID=1872485 RepID=UPI0039E2B5A6